MRSKHLVGDMLAGLAILALDGAGCDNDPNPNTTGGNGGDDSGGGGGGSSGIDSGSIRMAIRAAIRLRS